MLPKIKRFVRNNKKQVKIGLLVLLVMIILLVLYKSLFYSSSEKSVYGVRIRDIKEHEFTKEMIKEVESKSSKLEKTSKTEIKIKGRLIKIFVTFTDDATTDDIKARLNDIVSYIEDDVKSYYDIELYSIQTKDNETSYPVIGYKHKNKTDITFDVI